MWIYKEIAKSYCKERKKERTHGIIFAYIILCTFLYDSDRIYDYFSKKYYHYYHSLKENNLFNDKKCRTTHMPP